MTASAVLVNPRRVTSVATLRRQLARILSASGWPDPTWIETSPTDDGAARVRAAVAAGARVVFVCGGDGTVLAGAAAVAGTEAALALLPSGTGNVLALNLGIPGALVAGIRLGIDGVRRRIDLGEVDGQAFTVAAGIGFDAQMIADAPRRAKHLLGWPAYLLAALRHLGGDAFGVTVALDDGVSFHRQVRSAVVANVGRLPGGIRLLPAAVPDDGLLDIALIAPRRLRAWAQLAGHALTGAPLREGLETFQARRVSIVATHSQPREIDGEQAPAGSTLKVGIRPGALLVCVPPSSNQGTPASG